MIREQPPPPTFSACEAPDGRPAGSGAMSAVSIAPLIIVNPVSKPRLGPVLIPQIGDGHLSSGHRRLVDSRRERYP